MRSSAARLGIPVRKLTAQVIVPFGAVLLVVASILTYFATTTLQERSMYEQQVTVKTLFKTQASVHSSRNGLAVLSQNRGYKRIWVLSATGDILDSNKSSEIVTQLDKRWWDQLKDQDPGFITRDVQFGNQKLSLTALHHAEMGRWVAIVSKSQPIWLIILYTSLILVVGLILWAVVSALLWGTLSQKIVAPLVKLDERTTELIHGNSLSEAALDKLIVETAPMLGTHASSVVNLARKIRKAEQAAVVNEAQFNQLFDTIPSLVIVRGANGNIVRANKALAMRMSVDPAWIEGQSLATLQGVFPTKHLENWFSKDSSSKVGIDRIEMYPGLHPELSTPIALTIQPFQYGNGVGHLIVVDEKQGVEHLDVESSGDGASEAIKSPELARGSAGVPLTDLSSSNGRFLEGLMKVSGQFIVAFNEAAETVYWSPTAALLTGIALSDIPDMKVFTERVFATRQERKLFKSWLDGEPDERSQELKLKTLDGSATSRWYASEMDMGEKGQIGVLWAHLDAGIVRSTTSKREPVA